MKLDATDIRFLPAEFEGASALKLRTGDLLFTRYNGNRELVGACAQVGPLDADLVYPDKLIRVRLDTDIAIPAFVEAAVNTSDARSHIDRKLKTSAGQIGISGADLQNVQIVLAPLAEQQRIAAKLKTLLSRVDGCRERLERVSPLIKRFRQSVLDSAVEGRLPPDSDTNSPWGQIRLGDLVRESSVGLVRASAEQAQIGPGRVPYLKMAQISAHWGLAAFPDSAVKVTPEEMLRYELHHGDWLFNTRNSVELVGKSCVWPGGDSTVFNNNILRVRFDDRLNPYFAEIWFRSHRGRAALTPLKSATTSVAAIYQRALMDLMIDVPSLQVQDSIVKVVDSLFVLASRLEARLKVLTTTAERLAPATLAKAFRGELVSQDPNDEPAEVLLARIRAEREGATAPPSRRRRAAGTPA
jgi:type I restriction enzyme S subunit